MQTQAVRYVGNFDFESQIKTKDNQHRHNFNCECECEGAIMRNIVKSTKLYTDMDYKMGDHPQRIQWRLIE